GATPPTPGNAPADPPAPGKGKLMNHFLPTLTDEEITRCPAADPDAGFGALATPLGGLPLQEMDVRGRIDGLLVHLTLTQTFVNVHDEPLEATYVFPLPDR